MQILIGSAKIMASATRGLKGSTVPRFQHEADELARQMASYTADELADMLRCNKAIARENWLRYQYFADPTTRCEAVFSYDGMVFKKIAPETMSETELQYANEHLMIGSFLYGVLRPLDLINCYRLEGNVTLPNTGCTIYDYWKPILTEWFIDKIKADDGVLINLASNEFRDIFDWQQVRSHVDVVTPEFKVEREGRLKTIVIYAKMCRGAMTRWIIQNSISRAEDIAAFEYEGFRCEGEYRFILR